MTLIDAGQASGLSATSRRRPVPSPHHRGRLLTRLLPVTTAALDTLVVIAALSLAALGRDQLTFFAPGSGVTTSLDTVGPLIMLAWLVTLAVGGAYRRDLFGAGTDEYRTVLSWSMVTAGVVGVGCYLVKYPLPRGFFVLAFLGGTLALLLGRLVLRRVLQRARRQGRLHQRVLIAGNKSHVDEVDAVFRRDPWLGYTTVGALTPAEDVVLETPSGIVVVGNVDDAAACARQHQADVVLFAGGAFRSSSELRRLAWQLEEQEHLQVIVTPSVTDVSRERMVMRPVGGLPFIHLERPRAAYASRWGKRAFDVVGSGVMLLMLAPVLLAAAAAVRLGDRGPVFFRQERVGYDGRTFDCLKFRSMVVDAEARLAALHAETGYEGGLFKMEDDPRITRVGAFLRRYSLDELPQLLNVLTGDMSLVGPRPPLPHEVATYDATTSRRLRVRPGMTGLWQVSGRSDLAWNEAVRLDLYYVDNWSMLQDLAILFRTVKAVLRPSGAY